MLDFIREWSPLAAAVLTIVVATLLIWFARRTSAERVLSGLTAGLKWLKEIDDERLAKLEQKLARAFRDVDSSIGALRESVGDSVAQAASEIGKLRTTLSETYQRVDALAKRVQDSERRLANITGTLDGIKTILTRSRRITRFMLSFILVALGAMAWSVPKVMADDVGLGFIVLISDLVLTLVALAGFLNVSLTREAAAADQL